MENAINPSATSGDERSKIPATASAESRPSTDGPYDKPAHEKARHVRQLRNSLNKALRRSAALQNSSDRQVKQRIRAKSTVAHTITVRRGCPYWQAAHNGHRQRERHARCPARRSCPPTSATAASGARATSSSFNTANTVRFSSRSGSITARRDPRNEPSIKSLPARGPCPCSPEWWRL